MPSRNVIKPDIAETFYHVYARGASKLPVFISAADFEFFISLFSRYLSNQQHKSQAGTRYPHLKGNVELLAFCLMTNHFHLLLYQVNEGAMPALMRCVMTSYSRYFNRKYQRTGSLFETRYKASPINTSSYLLHISRYIHMNPRYWKHHTYSSLPYYLGKPSPEWLLPERVTSLFASAQDYLAFSHDYQSRKQLLNEMKNELADV